MVLVLMMKRGKLKLSSGPNSLVLKGMPRPDLFCDNICCTSSPPVILSSNISAPPSRFLFW